MKTKIFYCLAFVAMFAVSCEKNSKLNPEKKTCSKHQEHATSTEDTSAR
jgi:hypothetical protein